MRKKVLIIGGGAAGLAACSKLPGCDVTLLEAKDRFGGRIHTIKEHGQTMELGAEFVHGQSKDLLTLIASAGLKIQPASEENQMWEDRTLLPVDVWGKFDELTQRIDPQQRDESFQSFLDRQSLPPRDRRMMLAFATGFNAAHADRLSVHSLKRAEFAAEQMGGDKQSRIDQGYGALIEFLIGKARTNGVRLVRNCVVRCIHWKAGSVEVEAEQGGVVQRFAADVAIITLPLGVLKRRSVRFLPSLIDKEEAIEGMEFGNVIKVQFVFRDSWWGERDFGFIHSVDDRLPTWWSDPRGAVVTGWAGGAKADALLDCSPAELEALGISLLSRVFQVDEQLIWSQLLSMRSHNWARDPYAQGAYAYIPMNGLILPKLLAAPVGNTLFFAGEATATDAQLGTVFAAVETGYRAAGEVLGEREPVSACDDSLGS